MTRKQQDTVTKKEFELNKKLKLVYTYEGNRLKCHILFVIEGVLTKEKRKSEHYHINTDKETDEHQENFPTLFRFFNHKGRSKCCYVPTHDYGIFLTFVFAGTAMIIVSSLTPNLPSS